MDDQCKLIVYSIQVQGHCNLCSSYIDSSSLINASSAVGKEQVAYVKHMPRAPRSQCRGNLAAAKPDQKEVISSVTIPSSSPSPSPSPSPFFLFSVLPSIILLLEASKSELSLKSQTKGTGSSSSVHQGHRSQQDIPFSHTTPAATLVWSLSIGSVSGPLNTRIQSTPMKQMKQNGSPS